MKSKAKTDKELWSFLESLNDDLLDPDLPEDIVDEELRELGLDPNVIAKKGIEFINQRQERERLSWQTKARERAAHFEARTPKTKVPPNMDRQTILRRIDEIQKTYPDTIKMAARNRRAEESSDEDLRGLLEDMEMLCAMKEE